MFPHPVDLHVGKKLREKRIMFGMSQESLGESVGVTFQQIQKYEKGFNRIGSSRLYELSCLLDVNVSYFFEGLGNDKSALNEDSAGFEHENNNVRTKEILALVRAYNNISDQKIRKNLVALTKSLASTSAAPVKVEEVAVKELAE